MDLEEIQDTETRRFPDLSKIEEAFGLRENEGGSWTWTWRKKKRN